MFRKTKHVTLFSFVLCHQNFQRNIFHTHSLSNLLDILEEKLMTRQLKGIS